MREKKSLLICLLLAAITLAVYWPATHFDFLNYDDPDYVAQSPITNGLTLPGIAWAFTTRHASNWHPVTWLSHMTDHVLFGFNPGGPHLVNILLHTLNAVLLFLILKQLTGVAWRSALVAALFAWHPLHVESVAWVSERKDVLSGVFFFLTIAAYTRYVRQNRDKLSYALALLCMALGLMAKPMLVTLPLVLLLLDYWPLGRLFSRGLLLEKIPFLALSVADAIVTIWAQKGAHSVVGLAVLPPPERVASAAFNCYLYLWNMICPVNLAVPYPYIIWPAWVAIVLALVTVVLTVLLIRQRASPFGIVGWAWYLVMLAPVSGLFQTGAQAMADRYTYLPLIGMFIFIAWAIPEAWAKWPRPGLVFGAAVGGVLAFLLTGTETQLQYWRNSVALFSHTVAVTPKNIMAQYNLAEALARAGNDVSAITHYRYVLAINPNPVEAQFNCQTEARYNLGVLFKERGDWHEAEEQFRAFLRERPNMARAHEYLSLVLLQQRKIDEAVEQYQIAARLDPRLAGDVGFIAAVEAAYAAAGRYDEAIAMAEKYRAAALAEGRKDLAAEADEQIARYRAAKH